MWRPVVKVAPVAGPLVTFAAAAAELRLEEFDEADHQERVERYIASAEGHVAKLTGLQLAQQTVTLAASEWSDLEALPIAPVSDVAKIEFTDAAGDTQTLDPSRYEARLEGLAPTICLAAGVPNWPERQAGTLITITATAGFGETIGALPGEIVDAVLVLVRARNDTGVFDGVSATVDALLTNWRIHAA